MSWTAEALATTTRLWGEGFSATEIAKAVNAQCGIAKTRNAVIGVIYRARLPKRAKTNAARPPRAKPRAHQKPRLWRAKPKASQPMPPAPEPLPSLRVRLVDLADDQCHAVTDPTRHEQLYCGHPVMLGSCYCEPHFRRFRTITAKPARAR